MKYINYIFRFLVGALFIFSGFIKSNDTKGFAIKLHEYFEVFAKDAEADQDTFTINFTSGKNTASYAIPLYEQEMSKTYSIKTSITGEVYQFLDDSIEDTDANWDKYGYDGSEMAVNFLQATNSIMRDSLYAKDSAFAGKVTVTASIKGEEILTKTHDLNLQETEIIEAIDVKSYLKSSSWLVGLFEKLSGFATPMAMFLCLLEILLGIWLLLGIKPKLTVWLLLLMTLFFTFLTFYSAYYNKVTDCGCFGDAIKLTPWESFNKDVILTVLIIFLFLTARYIKPIFSKKFGTTISVVLMAFCTVFMAYSYLYLPVFDFLKYSEGSDLREQTTYKEGDLKQDILERIYIYKDANGKEIKTVYNSATNAYTPALPEGATFARTVSEKVIKKADVLPIHDWGNITSPNGNDISDSIMFNTGYTLLLPSVYVDKVHENVPEKINALYLAWKETGHAFYALSSSGQPEIQAFIEKYKVPYKYGTADNKLLMSMIRSNPGLILIKDGVVLKRWCFRGLPSEEKLLSFQK